MAKRKELKTNTSWKKIRHIGAGVRLTTHARRIVVIKIFLCVSAVSVLVCNYRHRCRALTNLGVSGHRSADKKLRLLHSTSL